MTDNRPKELRAEYLISHHLLKYDFKLSKPSFDEDGADLLILDSIQDRTTKFLKIQSKLRTISAGKNSSVDIPIKYVKENFVFFLYVNRNPEDETLYTFFKEDIEKWRINQHSYLLTVSENNLKNHADKVFNKHTIELLNKKLVEQPIKKYTSILIDGIFLEKALQATKEVYAGIWPKKIFKKPTLNEVIEQLLAYNKFTNATKDISCVLFLSDHHNLETLIDVPDPRDSSNNIQNVKLLIHKSNNMIAFEVLDQLDRIINAENVLLVADDVIYEKPLNDLASQGTDLILIKLHFVGEIFLIPWAGL
jgi:hypothetical protein